jgi:hypothetical protein
MSKSDSWPSDFAEFVFDTDEVVPLSELADSFKALDDLFARDASSGARLAVAELRQGSIVALLAPFMPILGPTMSFIGSAVDVSDFIKRLRDGLNAFAGIELADDEGRPVEGIVASEIAALVKPLAGRPGSRLNIAHVKYSSRSKGRVVEVEASYSSGEIDRIAVNASRASELIPIVVSPSVSEDQPSLIRKVVLTLQQTNTGPAKSKGKTGDRGIIESVTTKPLAVYFAKTIDDLKKKMVGRSTNPFRQPFTVDVLVSYEDGEPKSYTVIDVHRAKPKPKKKGPPDLLSDLG